MCCCTPHPPPGDSDTHSDMRLSGYISASQTGKYRHDVGVLLTADSASGVWDEGPEPVQGLTLLVHRPHVEIQGLDNFKNVMPGPHAPTAGDWTTHWNRCPARKKGFHSPRPGQAGSVGNRSIHINGLSSSEETEVIWTRKEMIWGFNRIQ